MKQAKHAKHFDVKFMWQNQPTVLACVIFFSFLVFVYWVYDRVLVMTSSFVTELRNVEWELFLLYTEGLAGVKPQLEAQLWAEVDRLEALIADG